MFYPTVEIFARKNRLSYIRKFCVEYLKEFELLKITKRYTQSYEMPFNPLKQKLEFQTGETL